MEDQNHGMFKLDSGKNDFLYWFFNSVFQERYLLMGAFYFTVSFGATMLLGLATGLLTDESYSPVMKRDYLTFFDIGVLAPVGIPVLLGLYRKINTLFVVLMRHDIILEENAKIVELVRKAQRRYENRYIVLLAFAISLVTNITIMLLKHDHWSGINGGITAYYVRFFILLNFYAIPLIFYKCAVTVWMMRRIFGMQLRLEPLHPDKCGGLRPLGSIAISINYLFGLMLLFAVVHYICDPFCDNIAFTATWTIGFIVCILLGVFSLSKAHHKMEESKSGLLSDLSIVFRSDYVKLNSSLKNGIYDKDVADEIRSIKDLFQIAEKMPVWPFDARLIARFLTTICIPAIIFCLQLISGSEAITNSVDKLLTYLGIK